MTQVVKIVLFNGPPRSGKDTAANIAIDTLGVRAIRHRFAEPLKDAVHALFGMPGILTEHFDDVKNEPNPYMLGMKPRDAYIWLSEKCVKPKFGPDFFGQVAVNKIHSSVEGKLGMRVAVISDCGFQEEVDTLIGAFGAENVTIVRMHREGCDFKNDSRSYVEHPISDMINMVYNDVPLEVLKETVKLIIGGLFDERK